jgi:hypothetical protein
LVAASYPLLWRGGVADRAIVKRDGQLVTELALNIPRKYEVHRRHRHHGDRGAARPRPRAVRSRVRASIACSRAG